MITDREGITNHAVLHDFHVAHQRFMRLGIEPHQAHRMAWYCAFRLNDAFNNRQAWEATDAIVAQQKGKRA